MLSARAEGYNVQLELASGDLTESSEAAVATLTLSPGTAEVSPLYTAIPERHTDRSAYADQPLEDDILKEIRSLIQNEDIVLFLYQPSQPGFQLLANGTVAATEYIIADAEMSRDSHAWFDKNWQEVQREKDGPFTDTAGVPALTRVFAKMMPPTPDRMIDDGWLSNTRSTLDKTSVLGLIAVRNLYDKRQSLEAGRTWQRIHLWATTRGIAMQPVNQLEQVDRERQLNTDDMAGQLLNSITDTPEWRPTFAFRAGYTESLLLPGARRSVAEVLV